MSRKDAEQRASVTDLSGVQDVASIHGKDRRALRKVAKYMAMGQVQPLADRISVPQEAVSASEGEGHFKI